MIQQSNCFQVVERGAGMQNMMPERALAAGGQMQAGCNIGRGQMVAADFIVTPSGSSAKAMLAVSAARWGA